VSEWSVGGLGDRNETTSSSSESEPESDTSDIRTAVLDTRGAFAERNQALRGG